MSTVLSRWTGRLSTRRNLRDSAERSVTFWRKIYHGLRPGARGRNHALVRLQAAKVRLALRERQVRSAERVVARHRHDQIPIETVRGIDVSNHQGTVNFGLVAKAGYKFAYLKATEGTTYKDPYFLENVKAAHAAGLKVGGYHFLRHGGADAQAGVFVARLRAAGLGKGDLMPVCDAEAAGVTLEDVRLFVNGVQRRLGIRCVIYTFPYFTRWQSTFGSPLWIAHFDVKAPSIPGPWTRYAIWQHSSSATVPGVRGKCDVNVCPDLSKVIA